MALAAAKGDKTVAELALHANQISTWKKELLERCNIFASESQLSKDNAEVDKLHAKIGQLTMENDFLESARSLDRAQHSLDKSTQLPIKRQCELLNIAKYTLK